MIQKLSEGLKGPFKSNPGLGTLVMLRKHNKIVGVIE
jgi:hypothetical protein